MNYFELYDIPLSFRPDAAAVKKKYYELSRKFHPDRFAQAGGDAQAEALKQSAQNNAAWKTLNSPVAVMAYILKEACVLEEEEKYTLPQAFLMEMMDLNEAVSDFELEPDSESLKTAATQALEEQLDAWTVGVTPLLDRFEGGEQDTALLLQIKDYYFRKKYLLRIQDRLATFAAR